jgi:hypothetical protein
MKTSRTCLGATKITFEFRASIAMFGFGIVALTLMPFPLNGAQFYTNWAAVHFSGNPAQGDPLADPDSDGEPNVVEFAFGTDPLGPGGIAGAVQPLSGGVSGTNAVFQVEILEREGHQPGVQIDLYLSAQLTNWFRPWWQRTTTNSLPDDPTDSVRELFSTRLPGTNVWFVRPKVQLVEGGAETAKYYVATNGSDGNFGTNIAAAFATLSKAVGLASPGDLIYVRGGTYNWTVKISISRSGNPTNHIRVRAYPGESPVFNFSGQSLGTRGIELTGNWWQLYGMEIVGAGDNGIFISGKSNVVERCITHACRDSGFQLDSTGGYNLILNCDSYRNYDPNNYGENADGFAAKFAVGPGNVFRGCRAWENSDDGWDLWQATNTVVIENCWTWRNGIDFWGAGSNFAGDGNGFKLGGNNYPGAHRLINGISFGNPHAGVDQNNNTAGQTVDNTTAWANSGANFNLKHGANTTPHIVRNNVSISGGSSDSFTTGTLSTNNSWQVLSTAASVDDLLSTNTAFVVAGRRDDGGLPENPFLRPVPTGRLVDKGTDIGSPFVGSAPDLGAYETTTW